ncbi:MAG: hypothetical protein C4296_08315 [Gemmataceae bacterium]
MLFRLGVLGYGEALEPYLAAIQGDRRIAITRVWDADGDRARRLAVAFRSSWCETPEQLMRGPVDAVLIGCAGAEQDRAILLAVEAGRPFLTVPPGASHLAMARQVEARVRQKGLVATVSHVVEYMDAVQEAKEYLRTHPLVLASIWLYGVPRAGQSVLELVWNPGSQIVHALRFFAGEVLDVQGMCGDETLCATCRMSTGTIAQVVCARAGLAYDRMEMELVGPAWHLHFFQHMHKLRLTEKDRVVEIAVGNQPHRAHLEEFVRAVQQGKASALASDYAQAVETLRTCQAIIEAGSAGRILPVAA